MTGRAERIHAGEEEAEMAAQGEDAGGRARSATVQNSAMDTSAHQKANTLGAAAKVRRTPIFCLKNGSDNEWCLWRR